MLILFGSPLYAQGPSVIWTHAATSSTNIFSFDKSSIKKAKNGHYLVWVKTEITPDSVWAIRKEMAESHSTYPWSEEKFKSVKTPDSRYFFYDYTLEKWEIDCEEEKFKTLTYTEYDERGNTLQNIVYEDERNKWSFANPGSVSAGVLRKICATKTK